MGRLSEYGDGTTSHLHEAFLERAAAPSDGSGGHALGAFLTMRLVDHFAADRSPRHADALGYQTRSTEEFLRNLHPKTAEVAHLLEIVRIATVAEQTNKPRLVWPPLLAFGYWLEQNLRLHEALDAVETALRLSETADTEESVAALYQRGRILRKLSRFADATAAFHASGEAARRLGDRHSELLSRIGTAIVLQKVGNLPESKRMLETVIAQAAGAEDRDAEARGRHDLANCLMLMDRPADAVREAFSAFVLYERPQQRLRALSDLGMAFKMLGNYSAAEDAFGLVLDGDACTVEMSVNAMLELLEVAAHSENRVSFERWRKKLTETIDRMAPDARVDFELKLGLGQARFGNRALACESLKAAVALAEEHGLNAYLFRAEAALERLDNDATNGCDEDRPGIREQGEEARRVAERLHALRMQSA